MNKLYSNINNFKSPEDMTMDEIKQQLALYQRLYYSKRKEDEKLIQKKREASLRHNQKKRNKEYIAENNLGEEDLTPTQILEIVTDEKPSALKKSPPPHPFSRAEVAV